MEIYDYREQKDYFEEASLKLDSFNNKQMKIASEAIDKIAIETEQTSQEFWLNWFDNAILPVLRDFAEMTTSLLEIEKNAYLITATLCSQNSIDFTKNCMARLALFSAAHIEIDKCSDGVSLCLSFDYNKYI
ncbi:hypothetical protein LI031_27945 [Enterocloster citroniae]|uniref:hypothetical protein n=1 Tax=Enterocloster citroniae TaxID=358743 RepID=UPI001D064715|nr:hypothetical protein [Enterocloster citroniae]MCB7067687.1 hypothetical protein [Enterocloster citroniae]